MEERDELKTRLEELQARKQELEDSIPAHSTKPFHIMQIEEIEDEIELLMERLEEMED